MKFTHRSSVLLPEPLGPMTQTTSPRSTSRSVGWRTVVLAEPLAHLPQLEEGHVVYAAEAAAAR